MARSDHGKPRLKSETEHDSGHRGPIGPFLNILSGHNKIRCKKYDWYWDAIHMVDLDYLE